MWLKFARAFESLNGNLIQLAVMSCPCSFTLLHISLALSLPRVRGKREIWKMAKSPWILQFLPSKSRAQESHLFCLWDKYMIRDRKNGRPSTSCISRKPKEVFCMVKIQALPSFSYSWKICTRSCTQKGFWFLPRKKMKIAEKTLYARSSILGPWEECYEINIGPFVRAKFPFFLALREEKSSVLISPP